MTTQNPMSSLRSQTKMMVWCSAGLYLMFILVLTHMPLDSVRDQNWFKYSLTFWIDKFIQCALYSGLVALLGCALFPLSKDTVSTIQNISGGRTLLLFTIILVIAILDEATQPMWGRNFEVLDIIADTSSVIPGFCLFLILNELRHVLLEGH